MARCGVVQNIVRHVLEPTGSQELLGFKPLYWHIFDYYITYYQYDRYVTWYVGDGYLGYTTGSRNFNDRLTVEAYPNRYYIDHASMGFEYKRNSCYMHFTSKYRLEASITVTHVRLRARFNPLQFNKKLPQPGLKLGGSFEDAQLALKYLLDLKDQMIKLGY
jgi:hypothetical protein